MAHSLRQRLRSGGKPPAPPPAPAIPCDFEFPWLFVGAKLEHKAFGIGVVTRLDLSQNSLRTLSIQFDGHGERTLMVCFANVHMKAHHARV